MHNKPTPSYELLLYPFRSVLIALWYANNQWPQKHLQPRGRGLQFPIGAVLQHSNTPSLRVAGFEDEDDDEDENEAPHEHP
jgi:hypothetical protein